MGGKWLADMSASRKVDNVLLNIVHVMLPLSVLNLKISVFVVLKYPTSCYSMKTTFGNNNPATSKKYQV